METARSQFRNSNQGMPSQRGTNTMKTNTTTAFIVASIWNESAQVGYRTAQFGKGISSLKVTTTREEANAIMEEWAGIEGANLRNAETETPHFDAEEGLTLAEYLDNQMPQGEGFYKDSFFVGAIGANGHDFGDFSHVIEEVTITTTADEDGDELNTFKVNGVSIELTANELLMIK